MDLETLFKFIIIFITLLLILINFIALYLVVNRSYNAVKTKNTKGLGYLFFSWVFLLFAIYFTVRFINEVLWII